MSKEDADKLIDEIMENPELQKEFMQCKTQQEFRNLVSEKGYHFTEEEGKTSFEEHFHRKPSKELDEAQLGEISAGNTAGDIVLAAVAGGMGSSS